VESNQIQKSIKFSITEYKYAPISPKSIILAGPKHVHGPAC